MVIFPSAARAAATYTQEARLPVDTGGIIVEVDATSATVGTVVTTVEVFDEAKSAWVALRDGSATNADVATQALADPGRASLMVHPALTEQKGAVNDRRYGVPVPRKVRISCVVAGATVTFSVSLVPTK